MADDPINISVTDGVDPNVVNKLLAIADASDKSASNIDRLKAALAGIRGDNLATLREQATTTSQAIQKELDATNALGKANADGRSAAASLAAETKNVKASADDATASIKRQTDATKALKDEQNRPIKITESAGIAPAVNSTLGGQAGNREEAAAATAAMASMNGAAKEAKVAVEAAEAAGADLAAKGPGFFARFRAAGVSAFDTVRDAVTGNGTRFLGAAKDIEAGAETAGAGLVKMTGHARGSSTAIRELLVIAREGGRGDFNRMAGSVSILANALGLLPIAIGTAVLGFGALYAARKNANTDAEKKSLEEYANTLGLTEKEMRKLKDTTLEANGHLKEHNDLQITYGDTFHAFIKTAREGLAATFGDMSALGPKAASVFDTVLGAVRTVFVGFYGLVMGLVALIEATVKNVAALVINGVTLLVNGAALAIQGLINMAVTGLNAVGGFINGLSEKAGMGKLVGELHNVDLGVKNVTQGMVGLAHVNVGQVVGDNIRAADRTLTAFGQRLKANQNEAARDRIKAEADAIRANRNIPKPKKETDPKTKDDFLDDENKKLDDQIKTFGMLKEARDVQQQLNAVEEAFIKRRMPLNDAEIAQFRTKIELIQRNNRVQAEMDKIYEDINGPQRVFNDGTAALNQLLSRGYITAVQFNQQMDKLKRTYDEARDPLFALNEQIRSEVKALDLTGDALDHYNNSEKVRQAFLVKGIDLTKNATAAQRAQAKAAVDALDKNDGKKYINGQVNSITDPMIADRKFLASKKDFYARIDEMEKASVIKHSEAERAKAEINAKYNELRLKGASDMFGNLAQLSSSSNNTLARIGRTAAIVQATIDGFTAVQKALASSGPPLNFINAAIVGTVAAVNVANIINTPVNAGSYWTGGDFIVRGKTGVDANQIAMNVSDGERVTIQTQAQQQAAANNNNKTGPAGDTHVNNFFDERTFVSAMDSQHGEKVVMNIIKRRQKEVKGLVK